MARCPVTLRYPPQKGSRLACSRRDPIALRLCQPHPVHWTRLGFWLRFGLSPLLTTARSLLLQRFFVRVRDFSIHACVSLLGMNKTGATHGRFYPPAAIYAAIESLSRPIVGHTPRKLPRLASNLPHHRTVRPYRRSIIVQHIKGESQGKFHAIFQVFSTVFPVYNPLCLWVLTSTILILFLSALLTDRPFGRTIKTSAFP